MYRLIRGMVAAVLAGLAFPTPGSAVSVLSIVDEHLVGDRRAEGVELLRSYGIEPGSSPIYAKHTPIYRIFQIRSEEFCREETCLTVIVSNCPGRVCPHAALLSDREFVESDFADRAFGGSIVVLFGPYRLRPVTVFVSEKLVAVAP